MSATPETVSFPFRGSTAQGRVLDETWSKSWSGVDHVYRVEHNGVPFRVPVEQTTPVP